MLQYYYQRGIDNSKSLVRVRVHSKRKQINFKMKFYLAAAVLATVLVAANCAPYQSEWTPDFSATVLPAQVHSVLNKMIII